MLSQKYETISPFIRDKTRLFALSGTKFNEPLNDEWMMIHLNNFVSNLDNPEVYNIHQFMTTREYPDLKRQRVTAHKTPSDILLKDTGRQNRSIEERYRRGLVSSSDIRSIMEPSTKYHIACSRGYERHLVHSLNNLENEHLNRRSIKPDVR